MVIMNIIEKYQVKHFHSSRLKKWENERGMAQGWTSEDVQQKRFDVITTLVNFNDTSVLDLGCGDGDLKQALDQKYQHFDYIGVDQQSEFIEYAKQRYADRRNTWFHQADFANCRLPEVDIIVVSGALSYRSENQDYYIQMIGRFFALANRTLIFNMLDDRVFESSALIISHNREKIYDQCKSICANTVIHTGYLDEDFTVVMNKN